MSKKKDSPLKHMELILYQEDGFTAESIENEIQKRSSVDSYCIAFHDHDVKEDRTPDKPHYHVYIHFGNGTGWTISAVTKWFGVGEHLGSRIKADKTDKNNKHGKYRTIRYYTHCDYPEKHQYDPAEFVANFDVPEFLRQEEAKEANSKIKPDLDAILNRCANGEITRSTYQQYMTGAFYAKNRTAIENAWRYYDDTYRAEHQGNRGLTVIFIHGGSGAGKSTLAVLTAQEMGLTYYLAKNSKNILDTYNDEEVVIIDDIRADKISFVDLLALLDPHYLSSANARYHNVLIKAKYIYLTTVQDVYSFYASYQSPMEPVEQLYRRIDQIWVVSKEKVEVYHHNNTPGFVHYQTVDNPVPAYLDRHQTSANASGQSVDLLGKIKDRYTDKQLSLFDNSDDNTTNIEEVS